jgi:uncharacterized tellurite resistance protein B-like protein
MLARMSTFDPQALDALAFLYLTFAHSTDGSLAPEEMRALAGKLRPWSPNDELAVIGERIKNAVGEYKSLSTPDRLARAEQCLDIVTAQSDASERVTILGDLRAIAASDGHVSAEEQAFMARVADRFGL